MAQCLVRNEEDKAFMLEWLASKTPEQQAEFQRMCPQGVQLWEGVMIPDGK